MTECKRYITVDNVVIDRHNNLYPLSMHSSEAAAKRRAQRLNRKLQEEKARLRAAAARRRRRHKRNLAIPDYRDGWNAAIDAACERLRRHEIDWLGDTSFRQMELEILGAVAALKL